MRVPLMFGLVFGFLLPSLAQAEGEREEDFSESKSADNFGNLSLPAPMIRSWDHWESVLEVGSLFKVEGNTASGYALLPISLTTRSPQHLIRWDNGSGTVVLRAQLRIFHQTILDAPESRYSGISAGPVIEWWFSDQLAWYNSVGGGGGILDSQDEYGAMGQDLTMNWYIQSGLRWQFDQRWSLQGGLLYQHMSNMGMTDPNPGLDAFGFTVGIGMNW